MHGPGCCGDHSLCFAVCRKLLLAEAGFRFSRLIKTRGVFSLVEAVPAKMPKRPESSEGSSVDLQRYKSHGVISVDFDPADLENEP